MRTIGFLGGGNMGRAIMEGLINSKLFSPKNILVFDVQSSTLEKLEEELKVTSVTSSESLVEQSDILVLSVKPHILKAILPALKEKMAKNQIIISIAAGVTLSLLEEMVGNNHKLVRVMPNTPALVGEGMAALCNNQEVTADEKEFVLSIFESLGKATFVPEHLIDAVVGVSGSGPAYVYLFIEALADGAVLEGMPRQDAYEFAAQTVLGSAKMVLETKKHPGELKDMVSSPGGTTIEGIKVLEDKGFRGIVIDTVRAVAEKNRNM